MLKILFLCIVLLSDVFVLSADAQTLGLDIGDDPGINLAMDSYHTGGPANLNSSYGIEGFNINNDTSMMPGDIFNNEKVNIAAFDQSNNLTWNAASVLSKYISWSEWVAISHQTADLYNLLFNKANKTFGGLGIDDMNAKSTFPIPEPATMLLLGVGLIGLSGLRNRVKNKKRAGL